MMEFRCLKPFTNGGVVALRRTFMARVASKKPTHKNRRQHLLGYVDGKVGGRREGLNTEMEKNPLGKDLMIVALVKLARLGEEDFADIQQPRQVGPVIHEVPDKDEGIQVEIREAGKRVVCRLNGKAWEISVRLAIVGIQRQLHEWWSDKANTKWQHEVEGK